MNAPDPFTGPRRMAPPETVELRGPADADHFRVAVGRYGDRWYCDPLPGCDIAPAWEGVAPSVSTIKKASGSDWSFVALKRVADAIDTPQYSRLDQQAHDHRYEALKAINKLGLSAAAQRGTNVHLMAEARLYGRPCPVTDTMPGAEYRGAVDAFFDQYQPELVAAEFVCVNRTLNGVGYGGTADAALMIGGKVYGVDWKSRGADSQHGAYPEEAAQLGAYFAGADYLIAEGDDGPERRPVPKLAGGLIVSIKPDGARVYPIDLDAGFAHFSALHAWWVARRDERAAIGRQWTPRKSVVSAPPASSPLRAATEAPDSNLAQVADAGADATTTPLGPAPSPVPVASPLRQAQKDRADTVARSDAGRRLTVNPIEGEMSDDRTFTPLQKRYGQLNDSGKAWIARLSDEATAAGQPFSAKGHRTVRRFELLTALVILAEHDADDGDTRHLLTSIDPLIRHLTDRPLGAIVGSLSVGEAVRFAELARGLVAGSLTYDPATGRYTISPAAA